MTEEDLPTLGSLVAWVQDSTYNVYGNFGFVTQVKPPDDMTFEFEIFWCIPLPGYGNVTWLSRKFFFDSHVVLER